MRKEGEVDMIYLFLVIGCVIVPCLMNIAMEIERIRKIIGKWVDKHDDCR